MRSDRYLGARTTFEDLQKQGICGEYLQDDYERCQSRVLEWLPIDPDRAWEGRIGACGTHLANVAARLKSTQKHRWQASLRRYEDQQRKELKVFLKSMGFDVSIEDNDEIVLHNAGAFIKKLYELGFRPPPMYGPPSPNDEQNQLSEAQNGQ